MRLTELFEAIKQYPTENQKQKHRFSRNFNMKSKKYEFSNVTTEETGVKDGNLIEKCNVITDKLLFVSRETKRKRARLETEISDDLAEKIILDVATKKRRISTIKIQWFEAKEQDD